MPGTGTDRLVRPLQTMPPDMATAITAYLRYMPRLTAAQQQALNW